MWKSVQLFRLKTRGDINHIRLVTVHLELSLIHYKLKLAHIGITAHL